mmetsp:Transcript_87067/g.219204  ORF Transcript_87067/g.219204 Transcript_87067/m.219204 type:complete len:582 (+) Transcript_87067:68-1813(+)
MVASGLLAIWLATLALLVQHHARVVAEDQAAAGEECQDAAQCDGNDDGSSALMQLRRHQKLLNMSELQAPQCQDIFPFCNKPVNCNDPIKYITCPVECNPECKSPPRCRDLDGFCYKPVNCSNPLTNFACPTECNPECQPPPPPSVDCSSNPHNGTCLAQQTACFLMGKMWQWTTSNENITKIKDQLRDQCYNNYSDPSLDEQKEQDATVPSLPSDCPDDSKSCAPDVLEYLDKNVAAKYCMKAGKGMAKGTVDMTKEILKHFKSIALKGTIAFAFVGSFVSAFFPSAGSLPPNPCTYAEDWGKCVWGQVMPFVEKFVDAKIDDLFQELWDLYLRGYQNRLRDIRDTADRDSEHFPNGTISSMPNKTRDRMFSRLFGVSDDMVGSAPLFTANHNMNTTASLYLSMFAGLHISVMSSVFGSWEYRTEGIRFTYQRHILCYARRVVELAIEARNARLKTVRVDHGHYQEKCSQYGYMYECPGQRWEYKDDWQGACGWNERCDQDVKCKELPTRCELGATCDQSDQQYHFDCHRAYVEEQGDLMWQDWIGAVPDWIGIVKNMQEADVQEIGLLGLGEGDLECGF